MKWSVMEMLMVSIIVIVKMTRLSERGWGDLWWSVSSTDLIMMNTVMMIRMFEVFNFLETPNIIFMKQVVGGRVRSFVTETLCRWIYILYFYLVFVFVFCLNLGQGWRRCSLIKNTLRIFTSGGSRRTATKDVLAWLGEAGGRWSRIPDLNLECVCFSINMKLHLWSLVKWLKAFNI